MTTPNTPILTSGICDYGRQVGLWDDEEKRAYLLTPEEAETLAQSLLANAQTVREVQGRAA